MKGLKLIIQTIKGNLYIIIPIICISLWALYYLISENFILYQLNDFIWFYKGGEQVLSDPANLYKKQKGFVYFPIFGVSLAIIVSIFPVSPAHYVFYCINLIAAIFYVLEFNKILRLIDLNQKKYRFLFLLIISNGFIIINIFSQNQTKFIVAVITSFIIRRELEIRKKKTDKDTKYFVIIYNELKNF